MVKKTTDSMQMLSLMAKDHLREFGGGDDAVYNVIIKELLHREILAAMQSSGLARKLAFQGGTAIRLCYSGPRLSEDLDFSRRNIEAEPVTEKDIDAFKKKLLTTVEKKFGVTTEMKDPKSVEFESDREGVDVKKWVFSVQMQDAKRSDRKHKIHIEIADIYALDARPMTIQNPYAGAHNTSSFLMAVSSAKEIYADKFVAFVGRDYIKPRDIYDIKHLKDQGYKWDVGLIENKLKQYGIMGGDLMKATNKAIDRSHDLLTDEFLKKYEDEMGRFLSKDKMSELKADDNLRGTVLDVADHIQHQSNFMQMNIKGRGDKSEQVSKKR